MKRARVRQDRVTLPIKELLCNEKVHGGSLFPFSLGRLLSYWLVEWVV